MILSYNKPDGTTAKIRLKTIPRSPEVTIGRGKEATICLEDGRCSRIHCGILYWGDFFAIRDAGSSNGTLVNGEKIDIAKLNAGDTIQIGDTEIYVQTEVNNTDVTIRG